MVRDIALKLIFGKPLVLYFGIKTLFVFLITAIIGTLARKGKVSIKWHIGFVILSFAVAILHGILALSIFLNF
ncbi:MAG: hypothetical protein PHI88_03715 [Candidatus Pacebacteria bacterium]|nr:hypothetical protein [Candidatus Paceibacterota bacterium]